jgi:hypothetical protein
VLDIPQLYDDTGQLVQTLTFGRRKNGSLTAKCKKYFTKIKANVVIQTLASFYAGCTRLLGVKFFVDSSYSYKKVLIAMKTITKAEVMRNNLNLTENKSAERTHALPPPNYESTASCPAESPSTVDYQMTGGQK